MEKVLRSLIHEKFDLDLRVEIEFLSRRRDLVNKEKQEELIKLLQSRNISNIVPLGPGTNRYAFKLDGFVIKVATDHDGKIDNLKEFKMAKRLYPYVTKTYEVSENGTLLVAEYIQPFESFSEMCKYADRIREILGKLSSVYLIGDVGITPNNFANWGLRVGTDDPVCLDFAYVYEVSSSLFLCRYCSAHAMLAPNKDFTELHCTNPACGRKYLFEDIRAKIGNDVHNHEIGDLSLEGYKLFSSEVKTELTDDRSNYLAKKKKDKAKKPKKPVIEEVPFVDNFVMEPPPDTIKGGSMSMSSIDKAVQVAAAISSKPMPGVVRIQATAVPAAVNVPTPPTPIIPPQPDPVEKPEGISEADQRMMQVGMHSLYGASGSFPTGEEERGEAPKQPFMKSAMAVLINSTKHNDDKLATEVPSDTSTLAFQGMMTGGEEEPDPSKVEYNEPFPPMTPEKKVWATLSTPTPEPEKPTVTGTIMSPVAEPAEEKKAEPEAPAAEPEAEAVPETKVEEPGKHQFEYGFVSTMRDVVSKLSNHIGQQMYLNEVYEAVQSSIRDRRMYKETFYKNAQSAVFRSLVKFMEFTEKVEPKTNGAKGTRHVFIPPADPNGIFEPTLIFIERLWKDGLLDKYDDYHSVDMLKVYRSKYTDYLGIQREWLEDLANRINAKMPVDIIGARKMAELVSELWCAPEVSEPEAEAEPAPEPAPEPEEKDEHKPNITDEEIINVVKGIFQEPDDPNNIIEVGQILSTDRANDLLKEVVREFGLKHYNAPLPADDLTNVMLTQFRLNSHDTSWIFKRFVNMETCTMWDTVDDGEQPIWTKDLGSNIKVVLFMAMMDLDAIIDHYREKVETIIKNAATEPKPQEEESIIPQMYPDKITRMTPAEAAAQILRSVADSEDDDDEEEVEETPGMVVHFFKDDDYDIIKISSEEFYGPVSIPFYTNLDQVSLENTPPSLIDDRNGVWDWMTHMVPDMLFKTQRPEYFMKINDEEPEPEQAKILILSEDHGTYTMGIYWLRGIFYVNDDDQEEPYYDPTFLAKINRVICEDIGYGRISHLKRSLSMEELIKPEEYVINYVLQTEVSDDKDEGGDEGMDPNMSAAEAAALSVIMNGSKALPDDASKAQKAFADEMHRQAFATMGIPTPETMAAGATGEEQAGEPAPVPPADGDMKIPQEEEETFAIAGDQTPPAAPPEPAPAAPAPIPVVTKQAQSEQNPNNGIFKPIRRGGR